MKNNKIRIAFDIGGVLSKYPNILKPMFLALQNNDNIEVFVMTDMHDPEQSNRFLKNNGFIIEPENVINCNYLEHGELCKANECQRLGIDILMDDFPGYLTHEGAPVRLMVMPDPYLPYYAKNWWTDGTEGDFGRRSASKPS